MAGDGMMRASDADRDAVVVVLREAYTAGRLTLEEFGERTSAAYAARTWGDLRELTADLPEEPPLGADVPSFEGRQAPAGLPGLPGQPVPGDPAHRNPVQPPGQPPWPAPPPPQDPSNLPPGTPRRRSGPASAVVPFVMVWFLIVLATRSPAAVAAPVVVLALLLLFTAISRRK